MSTAEAPPEFRLERADAAPGPDPHSHPDVAGFWDGLAEGFLKVQRCRDCGTARFPLAPGCHACLGLDADWEAIDPAGTVNVAVRAHEAVATLPPSGVSLPAPWKGLAPYLTGAVDMPAGVRLPGRIICRCGEALRPGTPVRAVLLDTLSGLTGYGFAHACE
ncbi:Zn-ribbon domain-containing OB-fold protein [Nocardioides campestrisoli]|uniref:Zn-ribbon domain-containing OB-fold protein n=1 Tax=Nocardioides campestrisoli TaxID=2736757 RepID=UPI0015E7227E|nr:zinc ribbon domain-containing protein [Nocardioides campestrisoli]